MFGKKPALPRPLERWFNDPILVTRLRELLGEDAFQIAAATLLDAAQPTFASLNRPAERNELRHAWLAGYRDAFRDLKAMSTARTPRAEDSGAWEHLTDLHD
jgi:hypothetical protein